MLEAIPASRLPYEWETIGPAITEAMALDTGRTAWDKLDLLFDARVTFWRAPGGLIVTQKVNGTLWILYAEGKGQTARNMRELLALIEHKARELKCREVRFEGRDWRRIARGYLWHRSNGRYHFRKAI